VSLKNKSSNANAGASLRNSDVAMRLAVIIGLGAVIGRYFDNKLHTVQPVYTIVFCLAAIGGSLFWIMKDLSKKN
jgi:F0F1-type ATP synthase assembly protein I